MKDNKYEYSEPTELREQGILPLRKIIKMLFIGIAVAFIIMLVFMIIFKIKNS